MISDSEDVQAQWRAMAPKKKVAAKLIVKSPKGNVLLVKPTYKKGWQFPGGGVELGESPSTALIREIKEEVNLVISEPELRSVGIAFHAESDAVIILYELQRQLPEDIIIRLQAEELEAYQFVSLRDVPSLIGDHYLAFWKDYSPLA